MAIDVGAVILASALLSVALAAALWTTTNNPVADRLLSGALLVLAGMMSVYSLGWTGRVEVPPALAFAPFNLPLALGPLLLGYVSALATGRGVARPFLHFAPAGAHFIYLCAALALPGALRVAWKDGVHDDVVKPIIEAATLASLAGYAFAGLRLLGRYRLWLERERSDADRYAALWIARLLCALLATLAGLGLVRLYTWFVGELESGFLFLWFAAFAAWLGVEGWRHSERRFPTMSDAPAAAIDAAPSPRAPSGPDWSTLGENWRARTQAEGWWREQDLTLAALAARL
ncbi:MAG: hypothetical protein K2Q06_03640, partial [Parvularculaceae bacterium]|nr:hypothetical protein [Parvularculaceae bacterium]